MAGGKRGPAPAPKALKLVKGERRDRVREPVPAEQPIRAPSWLSRQAKAVWRRYAPDLIDKRVLRCWDVEAFACYCDAVVRRRKAAAELDAGGEIVEHPVFNKNGELTGQRVGKNPWWFVWVEADAQVQRYGARFGLTPSDRSGITMEEPAGGATSEDLLTG